MTLLFNSDVDDLFTLLLRYFPQALVALIALIALALWHAGMRQGPIQAPAPKARRQLQRTPERQRRLPAAPQRPRHAAAGLAARYPACAPDAAIQASNTSTTHEQWQVLERLTRQPSTSSARPSAHSRQNGFPAPISAGRWHACKLSGMPYERISRAPTALDRVATPCKQRQPAGPGPAHGTAQGGDRPGSR